MPRPKLPPGPGRPKGSKNKQSRDIRQMFQNMIERNADKLDAALDKAITTDPLRALQTVAQFAEYCIPKLQRTEHTGEAQGAIAKLADAMTDAIAKAPDAQTAAEAYQRLLTAAPAAELPAAIAIPEVAEVQQ